MRKATVIGFTPIKTKVIKEDNNKKSKNKVIKEDNNKKSKNKVIKEDNNKINSAKE